ncbi:hypothetical protein [Polluticaenibacter yanchengensis]|uniref:Uncharacterized protein n=1 Tax=Polluticaenibacter yanchengensis TaxID=3014562 RepID=A0ABT4ULT5_9BACT|nr:hypothetical protein [Chitinophagaceae bacterium LY-5]
MLLKTTCLISIFFCLNLTSNAQCEKLFTKVDTKAVFKSGKSWIHFIREQIVPVFEHVTIDELADVSNLEMDLIIDTSGHVVHVKFPGNVVRITKYLKIVESRIMQNTYWEPAIRKGKKYAIKVARCYQSANKLTLLKKLTFGDILLIGFCMLLGGFTSKAKCDTVDTKVDKPAKFVGGTAAFRRFIEMTFLSVEDMTDDELTFLSTIEVGLL